MRQNSYVLQDWVTVWTLQMMTRNAQDNLQHANYPVFPGSDLGIPNNTSQDTRY